MVDMKVVRTSSRYFRQSKMQPMGLFFGTGAATGLTGGICDVIIFYDGILGRAKACSFIFWGGEELRKWT